MKTYSRPKSVAEIRAQCAAQAIAINTTRHDKEGWDHIVVTLPGADGKPTEVLYNTFNGRFFAAPKDNPDKYFSSDDGGLDGKPWFDSMLEFFYV